MTKNIWSSVIVIVVLLIIIGGAIIYSNQNNAPVSTSAVTSTSTSDNSNPVATNPTATSPQPSTPNVVTSNEAIPTDSSVVVSGTVTPNGSQTNYWYEFGTTPNLGSKTSTQNIGSGYEAIPAPGYITGLTTNTTYYFQLVGQNDLGKVIGSQFSFQTTTGVPAPLGSVPNVRTTSATGTSRNGVTLNGTVTPNQSTTSYWFEYGTTKDFGNTTSLENVGNGTATVAAAIQVLNLDPLTTYYYRLNAENQFGTTIGTTLSFKTIGPAAPSAPTASTKNATSIKSSTATLNATLNSNGLQTLYWFEFSTDSQLASSVQSSSETSAGSGVNLVSVSANATGLSTSTTYYFRIVTQNNLGTARGDILSFMTER